MALTQMQLIQSLGEAMNWLERELQWGVKPTEVPHLIGRIGELYVALLTNGQMAETVNQRGYDVVSAEGERISVKTTGAKKGSNHISFNANTLSEVDRVIVLRINDEEMEIETLLDAPFKDAEKLMSAEKNGRRAIHLGLLLKKPEPKSQRQINTAVAVTFNGYTIRELENGTIEVETGGDRVKVVKPVKPVKPVLRQLADQLQIPLLNANNNPFNTRQLGSQVIKSIQQIQKGEG